MVRMAQMIMAVTASRGQLLDFKFFLNKFGKLPITKS